MAANSSKLEVAHRFFSGTGFSYDQVVAVCTCGLDKYWKRRILAKIPPHPTRLIDQACGTGILTMEIARTFPDCQIIGIDLHREYLSLAREKMRAMRIENVTFILGRAEEVVLKGTFDCITSSYLAKYADTERLLMNAGAMLRPAGVIIMHDFTYPSNPLFLRLWQTHFRLLRVLVSRVYPEWRTVFHELPEFLRQTRWVSDSINFLKRNDFADITSELLAFGTSAIVTGRKSRTR